MGLLGAFRRSEPAAARARRADRERVAALAREAGGFGPAVTLTVSEIVCPDPACPGTETVILVMAPGARTRACKVAKPVEAVTAADVAAALAG
ncbi:hypothetical protein OPKNFCMD_4683 [Methylobacterium crusticola]|uniref:Nitrate reductase n=1 Tax=Methylobacterium crusticola TaxID=1697972 RepID=A0ABQ4R450_9HYPH|nr:hypothetical protein [Methylobacterium crusticola]GJD51924.1 hypothetical protein OPKNFCMD_4683 [Methylobacterium crusticola]